MGLLLGNTNYLPIMKKRKATADNIIINGALNNSVNSWAIHSNNTVSFRDDYTTIKLMATGTGTYANTQYFPLISGGTASTKQIIYACAKVRSRTANTSYPRVYLSYYKNGSDTVSYSNLSSIDGLTGNELNDGEWHIMSGHVHTYNSNTGDYFDYNRIAFGISTATTGDEMDIKEVYLVNLTDAFGAGNEPTKNWCDANLTNYAEKIPIQNGRLIDETYSEIYIGNELIYPIKKFSTRFITVGTDDGTRYSLDGYNWFEMTGINSSHTLQAVAYGDGRLVAVGNDGKSYYSLDGETWVAMTGLDASYNFSGVAFGNDRFVTIGESGRSYYSLDGETWTRFTGLSTGNDYTDIIYADDRFITVGQDASAAYSLDGESWVSMSGLPDNNYGSNLIYVDNIVYCLVSNETIYQSTDKTKWTRKSTLPTTTNMENFAYGNGIYVISSIGKNTTKKITAYYSTNLIDWTEYSIPIEYSTSSAEKIVFEKDRFLIFGNRGFFAYSFDGITWTAASFGNSNTITNDAIFA